MPSSYGVYGRLPRDDKRTIVLYAWMAVLTIVLVVMFFRGQDLQSHEIQAQRRNTLVKVCQVQNAKHHQLFVELRHQREADATLREPARANAKLNDDHREALVETLEPWLDCTVRVKQFAP